LTLSSAGGGSFLAGRQTPAFRIFLLMPYFHAESKAATFVALLAALLLCGAAAPQPPSDIGATGTIEPKGGLVLLSGVSGATIKAINVHVGQSVKRGDLLMTLVDDQAQLDAKVAADSLDKAKEDAKQSISAEALTLKLDQEHYRQALKDAQLYRELGANATSVHQRAVLDAAAEDARVALTIEQHKYDQVQADSGADVDSAARGYDSARVKLGNFQLRAPSDGVILAINQHVGEALTGPALQMGDISVMYVSCQVFQGDLLKVKPGMKATITSNAFEKPLTGKVEYTGRLVQSTAQLGDVRIRLDNTELASRLVGMEVNVKIVR
jgi:HlyD family secretion protein